MTASVSHNELTGDTLHIPFRWVQEGDPGGGADHPGHFWLKLSTAQIKRRLDDDSGWQVIGGAPDGLTGTLFTTKGDLLTATAADTPIRKGAGADGTFLRPKAANADGLEWYDHEGAADPHPGYTTSAEATTIADAEAAAAIATHVAAADPHPGYVLESLLDTKGDLIAASADNTPIKLPAGTDGYLLKSDSGAGAGLSWVAPGGVDAAAIPKSLVDAKGDLIVGTADDTVARKAAGADGLFLRPKAANSDGLEWYDHEGAADPHPVYTTNAEATTIADTEAAAAVATHVALADPHPVYTTAAELAAALTAYLLKSAFTTKGDIFVATASGAFAVLPVGTDGQVLTADSSASVGVSWQTTPSSLIPAPFAPVAIELLGGFDL